MNDSKRKKLSHKEIRKLVIKALKLNEKADKGYTLRAVLDNMLYLASEYLAIVLVQQIINGIADGKGLNEMLRITALNVGLCMLAYITSKAVMRRRQCHEASHSQNLNNMINEKVMRMDFSHIESPDTNSRIERTVNNMFGGHSVSSIPEITAGLVYNIFTVIIGVIMILPSVFIKSGQSGIVGFICSPLGFISAAALVTASEVIKIFVFNARFDRAYEEIQQNKEENLNNMLYDAYLGQALRSYRSGKEIRIYGQQELFIGEMERSTQRTIKLSYDTYKKCYKYNLGLQLMNLISRIIMYGYSIFRAMYGTLSPGDVIAFVMLFTRISSGITNFSDNISMCRIAATYIKDVFDFLEMPDEQYKGTIPTEKRNDNEYEFEFRHVWFKYPNTEQYVL
ncbi:ABC transporter ATP-binding protein, partial [uncultured Ruminococcus sp.]|uniref:ABC transporter ATP-binding protein n=1 Tax=uncultured Ruminococcus sp. TaxID=165186 RepID=UPI0025F70987